DCAEGGLAVALAECCVADSARPLGLDVHLSDAQAAPASDAPPRARAAAWLFGEAQGRIVLSCPEEDVDRVLDVARENDVPAARIGTVGTVEGRFRIAVAGAGVEASAIDLPVGDVAIEYHEALPRIMEGEPGAVEVAVEHPAMPR
ncbi:MAG: AIR synthase-related protein, partial [Longimicrobiales bacterium]